jgi:hypothetical protein
MHLMPQGIADLAHSERGAFCLLVLLAVTVLVVAGKLDGTAWIQVVMALTGLLVASKTVTTAVETAVLKRPQV